MIKALENVWHSVSLRLSGPLGILSPVGPFGIPYGNLTSNSLEYCFFFKLLVRMFVNLEKHATFSQKVGRGFSYLLSALKI